jgi:DNA-binding transcriptional LysR family regulator
MEPRHLRYFIAVAEEGSFLTAAERRLHTAQPSLSRQIRDLRSEVGVKLLERKARGVVSPRPARFFSIMRGRRSRKSRRRPKALDGQNNPKSSCS